MRTILLFLLWVPIWSFASTLEFIFSVHEYQTHAMVSDVTIRLGDNSATTSVKGEATFHVWTHLNLRDTLFIEHKDYVFEMLPLPLQQIQLRGDKIYIAITAYPKVSRVYRFNSKEDRKKYPKDQRLSIRAQRFNPDLDHWHLINGDTVHDLGQPTFDKNFILKNTLSPEQFDQGFHSKIRGKEYQFQIDWFQENYLFYPRRKSELETKLHLIEAYFTQIATKRAELAEIDDQHQEELDLKQAEIDSLKSIILKEPYFSPPLFEEPEPEPYFNIGDLVRAKYHRGEEKLYSDIQSLIDTYHCPKKAKLAIWFKVDKNGMVRPEKREVFPGTENLAEDIIHTVCVRYWEASRLNGKSIEDRFIVSVDLE